MHCDHNDHHVQLRRVQRSEEADGGDPHGRGSMPAGWLRCPGRRRPRAGPRGGDGEDGDHRRPAHGAWAQPRDRQQDCRQHPLAEWIISSSRYQHSRFFVRSLWDRSESTEKKTSHGPHLLRITNASFFVFFPCYYCMYMRYIVLVAVCDGCIFSVPFG